MSYPRSTTRLKRTEDCSSAAVKPTVLKTLSVNSDEFNIYVHFRYSSDISNCACRPTSFPGSGRKATSATMMDPLDKMLYKAEAHVSDEEEYEQITSLLPNQLTDEFCIQLLHNYLTKNELMR